MFFVGENARVFAAEIIRLTLGMTRMVLFSCG